MKAFIKDRECYQPLAAQRKRLASLLAVETFPYMRQIFFSSWQTVISAIKKHRALFPECYLLCKGINICKIKIEARMIYSRETQQRCKN